MAWRYKCWPWVIPPNVVKYGALKPPNQADIDRGEELAKERGEWEPGALSPAERKLLDAASEPKVGDRYVSTDQVGACKALGIGVTVGPLIFVTVSDVFPEHRKVKVVEGLYWLTYDELAAYFRPRGKVAA